MLNGTAVPQSNVGGEDIGMGSSTKAGTGAGWSKN